MARASARRSPLRTPAARVSRVQSRRADSEAERHQSEPGSVRTGDPVAFDEPTAPKAAENEAAADSAVEQAVAEVAGMQCVLRHEHLADADRTARERGQAPSEQH